MEIIGCPTVTFPSTNSYSEKAQMSPLTLNVNDTTFLMFKTKGMVSPKGGLHSCFKKVLPLQTLFLTVNLTL